MQVTAQEIANYVCGTIVGNPNAVVTAPARIEYGKEGNICFLANPKYEKYIYTTKATIFLVNRSFKPKQQVSATLIQVDDAYSAVAKLLDYFTRLKSRAKRPGIFTRLIHPNVGKGTYVGKSAVIERSARVGKGCQIYPQVYIGDHCVIGDNVILYSGVKIYHESVIGDNCIIHSNSVIGADGFGFAPQEDGSYSKIQQTGNVILEDNVEIGANTTVDRATMGSTVIHKGVKLDNHIQIAHNVEIGENTVMAAQVGVAGSTHIGKSCVVGGQVGFAGHLHIADGSKFGAKTGVMKDIKKPNGEYMGSPSMDLKDFLRASVKFRLSGKK